MDQMAQIKTRWRFAVEQLICYPSALLSIWLGTTASRPLILIATPIGLWTEDAEFFLFLTSLEMQAWCHN